MTDTQLMQVVTSRLDKAQKNPHTSERYEVVLGCALKAWFNGLYEVCGYQLSLIGF